MSEWRECKLGEVITSNTRSLTREYPHKVIKYLDTGSITCGKTESYQEFTLEDAPSRAKRLVKDDDIVYSTVRPIQRHYGYIKNPPANLVVSTGFSVIETNRTLAEPLFIYNLLTSNDIVGTLDSIADGSTSAYPSLKPSDIDNIDILLPPLPEQKAIASVLCSLDDKIDLLHRQNKTLESMAETLFRQWFVEEAGEDWEKKLIAEVVSVVDNRGKTPPNGEEYTPYPVIEVNALGNIDRLVDYSVVKKYVDEEIFQNWFRNKLRKYDTLISTVGSIGALSMYVIEKGNIAQNIIGIHAEDVSSFYLYQFLKHIVDELLQFDIGGVQPSLKVPHLLSISIPIPNLDKQKQYDIFMYENINKIENNYLQIKTLERLRDTLLPKLMSGAVRVVEV